jgi:hypothetical protein
VPLYIVTHTISSLISLDPSSYEQIDSPSPVRLVLRRTHLFAGYGLLLLFDVIIHLSLLFSAGQGMSQVDPTMCTVVGLHEI